MKETLEKAAGSMAARGEHGGARKRRHPRGGTKGLLPKCLKLLSAGEAAAKLA